MTTIALSNAEISSNLCRFFVRDTLQESLQAELTELTNIGSGSWRYERTQGIEQVVKGVATITIVDGVAQIEATEQQAETLCEL